MNKPKIIAFFLPQFHEIPENNEWHWKWFTEWTNVKKAKPLFKWHLQPKIPYEYYNLLDKNVRRKIWEMAKEYWIYGFCYYHYRFEGKMLLEKPLELFLEDWYPDINFCFSWANHTWQRTWWKWKNKKTEILLKQTYWNEEEREKHFMYLLKFFKNDRYIKIDNKPVFLIYNLWDIDNHDDMIDYWNNLAKKYWFDGISFMETFNSYNSEKKSEKSDWIVQFEPLFSLKGKNLSFIDYIRTWFKLMINKYILSHFNKWFSLTFQYDKIWKKSLRRNYPIWNKKIRFWGFSKWDNTPRKKKNWYILVWASPEKFWKYMKELMEKWKQCNSEFIFVNAWNERAEGCYLEPDEQDKFGYLEEIKKIVQEND